MIYLNQTFYFQAKKSLDLLNDIQNEFYSKEFKKTLQKLDEIMFTIIDFNDFMEKKSK